MNTGPTIKLSYSHTVCILSSPLSLPSLSPPHYRRHYELHITNYSKEISAIKGALAIVGGGKGSNYKGGFSLWKGELFTVNKKHLFYSE